MDKVETRKIEIINKSKSAVYCFIATSDSFTKPYISYPQSSFDELNKVNSNSFIYIYSKERSWESFIDLECYKGKLRLFIVPQDSVDKYGWKKVLEKSVYSKGYNLSISDLNNCEWKIIYDGN